MQFMPFDPLFGKMNKEIQIAVLKILKVNVNFLVRPYMLKTSFRNTKVTHVLQFKVQTNTGPMWM